MAKAKTKSVRLITKDFSRATFSRSFASFFIRRRHRRRRLRRLHIFFLCAVRHQIKVCA